MAKVYCKEKTLMKTMKKFCELLFFLLLAGLVFPIGIQSAAADREITVHVRWEDFNNDHNTRPTSPADIELYLMGIPLDFESAPVIIDASTELSNWTIGNEWIYKFSVTEEQDSGVWQWFAYENKIPQHYFSYDYVTKDNFPGNGGGVPHSLDTTDPDSNSEYESKDYVSSNNEAWVDNVLDFVRVEIHLRYFADKKFVSGVPVRLNGKAGFGPDYINLSAVTDNYGVACFPLEYDQRIPAGDYTLSIDVPDGYMLIPDHVVHLSNNNDAFRHIYFIAKGNSLTVEKESNNKIQNFEYQVELDSPVLLGSMCPPKWKAICLPGLDSIFNHYDIEWAIFNADGELAESGMLEDSDYIGEKIYDSLSDFASQVHLNPREIPEIYYDQLEDGKIKIVGNRLGVKKVFLLKDGQYIVFDNLPEGVTYKITETKTEGYVTQINNQDDEDLSVSGTITINTGDAPKYTYTNTYTLVDISARKIWEDNNNAEGIRPQSVTLKIYANGEETDHELVLSEGNGWESTLVGLDKLDENGAEIEYTVEEVSEIPGYVSIKSGDLENGFVFTNTLIPDRPERPNRSWFRFDVPVLPKTGFSAVRPSVLSAQPLEVNYKPLRLTLEVPAQSVSAEIVQVPFVDDEYAVEWLSDNVGLLEGSAMPGEGHAIITGHNHLNTMEAGPFAFLMDVEEGDRIYVLNSRDELIPFTVYASEKIAESDVNALERIAMEYENSLTLLTCEDERPEGGYASRRVVAARPLSSAQ